ncbi:hypothetical protein FHR83_006135 [Actinoplanes campanulatus]|uniref:Pimeloyl-ACP methyl ester carboxylesterase n=1 Tax=Actinoplanes campanulatus TaxID=113559 RepID=A0A7W5ALR6_9ACTN|nr:hypothetical protein [Actinoplanes campanulatus]GGN35221.1 hypothetical protein GCM10010109_59040 [Actinoplanes campanulatus]GID39128.1 hypothetical protein Aca09nite_56340 [Actinoplanes campanulatus]
MLAVCGAADPRWHPDSVHDYARIPGARVELLPGVGHVPMLEAPNETTKLLLSFTAAWSLLVAAFDWTGVDIAVPRAPIPLPGVRMAGFTHRGPAVVDIAMVAHPAVTLLLNLGPGRFTTDLTPHAASAPAGRTEDQNPGVAPAFPPPAGAGCRMSGSVVIGLLPGAARTAGSDGELLQIRLEPTVAAALPGSFADLTGTAAAFHDVWTGETEERLRTAPAWQQRFAIAIGLLGRMLDDGRPVDPEVTYAWRRIRHQPGPSPRRRPGRRGRMEPPAAVVPVPLPAGRRPETSCPPGPLRPCHPSARRRAAHRRRGHRGRLRRPVPPAPRRPRVHRPDSGSRRRGLAVPADPPSLTGPVTLGSSAKPSFGVWWCGLPHISYGILG